MDTTNKLLNPDPLKQGATINAAKYDASRTAILDAVRHHGRITYNELVDDV